MVKHGEVKATGSSNWREEQMNEVGNKIAKGIDVRRASQVLEVNESENCNVE